MTMSSITVMVVSGASLIAMGGGIFGVGMARMFWAHDLQFTQHLEETRTRIQEANEKTIALLKERLSRYEAGHE